MKILFIGNTRLGDAILSTSLLNYFNNDSTEITVVCSPLSKEIYDSFSSVKKLIVVTKKKRGRHWLDVYFTLEGRVWDLVIDLRNTIISRIVRKKKVIRYKVHSSEEHRVEALCKLANIIKPISPRIPINYEAEEKASFLRKEYNLKGSIIAIAPVTNWKRKNWPVEKFALLINKLVDDAIHRKVNINSFIVLGSIEENKDCERLIKKVNTKNIFNLSGKVNLITLLALLKKCTLFVGNDSGLMHLAAAAEINTLGLFGPSKDINYSPWGEKSFFLRTKKSYEELVCSKGYNRFDNSTLMDSLEVDNVYKKCISLLKKKAN